MDEVFCLIGVFLPLFMPTGSGGELQPYDKRAAAAQFLADSLAETANLPYTRVLHCHHSIRAIEQEPQRSLQLPPSSSQRSSIDDRIIKGSPGIIDIGISLAYPTVDHKRLDEQQQQQQVTIET